MTLLSATPLDKVTLDAIAARKRMIENAGLGRTMVESLTGHERTGSRTRLRSADRAIIPLAPNGGLP